MTPLWRQDKNSISEEEALNYLFGDNSRSFQIADLLYNWIKQILPFRCGVRMGKDRISFLVGNYRPAAIKRKKSNIRLDMVFADGLPKGFRVASDVWQSVPNTVEGYIVVQEIPLSLTEVEIGNFVKACEQMVKIAPKSRRHLCNVLATWPEGKTAPLS